MSNIMAAIGSEQLKRFSYLSEKRQFLAKKYDKLFYGHGRISCIPRNYNEVVPHIYVLRIKKLKNRKQLKADLLSKGIQVGYHYQPNHWLDYYNYSSHNSLPITERVFPELLTIPLHPDLTVEDIEYVAKELFSLV